MSTIAAANENMSMDFTFFISLSLHFSSVASSRRRLNTKILDVEDPRFVHASAPAIEGGPLTLVVFT